MYLSHYNLKIEPFSISTDSRFLWLGEKHKEALAALKYGILANKGFLMLTGDVGTGKTTLIHALVNNLGRQVRTATVQDPGLEKLDFFNFIAGAFKLKKNFKSKGEFLSYFSLFLRISYEKNKKVLLIIDEAQRLSDELLEEIRLLSNIEKQHTKLINIFFVGQNEFNDILVKNENRALRQRITLVHTLETLNLEETRAYIHYRLSVAGSTRDIFKPDAIEEVYAFSGGYPRLINIVCDRALLTGYVREKAVINAQTVQECAHELRIPIQAYEKEDREPPPPAPAESSKEGEYQSPPRVTIRTVFLLLLLFLAAAAFYFQDRIGLAGADLGKSQDRLPDAALAAKTSSSLYSPPIPAPDNVDAIYPISDQDRIGPEETTAPPPAGPAAEKASEQDPADVGAAENADQPAETAGGSAPVIPDNSNAVSPRDKKAVYFGYNSFDLTEEALSELEKIAALMARNSARSLLIKGYTDNTGNYSYNVKLSASRALVVKNHLVKNGVDPIKIQTVGLGPVQTPDGRGHGKNDRRSRRVEIELN